MLVANKKFRKNVYQNFARWYILKIRKLVSITLRSVITRKGDGEEKPLQMNKLGRGVKRNCIWINAGKTMLIGSFQWFIEESLLQAILTLFFQKKKLTEKILNYFQPIFPFAIFWLIISENIFVNQNNVRVTDCYIWFFLQGFSCCENALLFRQ